MSEKEKGNAAQAMALLEALLDSEGFSSDAAGNLAMLYAEQDKDITKALELAQSSEQKELTEQIQNHLLLYKASQPYREPPAAQGSVEP